MRKSQPSAAVHHSDGSSGKDRLQPHRGPFPHREAPRVRAGLWNRDGRGLGTHGDSAASPPRGQDWSQGRGRPGHQLDRPFTETQWRRLSVLRLEQTPGGQGRTEEPGVRLPCGVTESDTPRSDGTAAELRPRLKPAAAHAETRMHGAFLSLPVTSPLNAFLGTR